MKDHFLALRAWHWRRRDRSLATGLLAAMTALVGLAIVVGAAWLPSIKDRRIELRERLQEIEGATGPQERGLQAGGALIADSNADALRQFQAVLLPKNRTDYAIAELFALAQAHGVQAGAAEYEQGEEYRHFDSVRLTLPLKGRYAAIRGLVADILVRQPAFALDELVLQRQDIKDEEIGTTLRLRLFLRPLEKSALEQLR